MQRANRRSGPAKELRAVARTRPRGARRRGVFDPREPGARRARARSVRHCSSRRVRERVRAEIRAELDARMHAMSILAREWQDRLLPRRGDWESDVRLILSQSPGLHSIAWVDAKGEHSWAYPPEAELPAIDLAKAARGRHAPRRGDGAGACRATASRACAFSRRSWSGVRRPAGSRPPTRATSCSRRSSRASTPRSRSTSRRARSSCTGAARPSTRPRRAPDGATPRSRCRAASRSRSRWSPRTR